MLLATKGNREIKIDNDQQETFEKDGYLVYSSETLELLTKPDENTVVDLSALESEVERLKAESVSLNEEIELLKKANKFELTNNQIKEILTVLGIKFNEKDNKDTLQTLLLNHFNPLGEK